MTATITREGAALTGDKMQTATIVTNTVTIDRRISFLSRASGRLYWADMSADQRDAVFDTLAAYVERYAFRAEIYPDAIRRGYEDFARDFCPVGEGVHLLGCEGFVECGLGTLGVHHRYNYGQNSPAGCPVYRLTRVPAARLVVAAPADRLEVLEHAIFGGGSLATVTLLLGTEVRRLVIDPRRPIHQDSDRWWSAVEMRHPADNRAVIAAARAAGCLPALVEAVRAAVRS